MKFFALILVFAAQPALANEPDYVTAATAGAFTVTSGIFTARQVMELNSDWRAVLPEEHEAVDRAKENLARAKATRAGVKEARAALLQEKEKLRLAQKAALPLEYDSKEMKLKMGKIKIRSAAAQVSLTAMLHAGFYSLSALKGSEKEFQPFAIESQNFERKRPTGISGMLLENYEPTLEADTAK